MIRFGLGNDVKRAPYLRDTQGKRRLIGLPLSQRCDGRRFTDQLCQFGLDAAVIYPCKYGVLSPICTVICGTRWAEISLRPSAIDRYLKLFQSFTETAKRGWGAFLSSSTQGSPECPPSPRA